MTKNYNLTIVKDGEIYNIPVEWERKKRKNLILRVYPKTARVLFSMPTRTPEEYAQAFFENNKPWLKKQLENILPLSKGHEYLEGEEFYYFGEKLSLEVLCGKKNRLQVSGNKLLLEEKHGSNQEDRKMVIEKALEKELAGFLQKSFTRILEIYRPFLNLKREPTFKLRKMTSKWGICRPFRNEITFSKRLVHVAPELIDYVVAHELCHFGFLDHSPQFWQLLQSKMPDCRQRRVQLNKMHLLIDL